MTHMNKRIAAVTAAYELERGWWDWEPPVPEHCDASYFRLRRLTTLDAPVCVIENEIKLLYRKIAVMRFARLGTHVH